MANVMSWPPFLYVNNYQNIRERLCLIFEVIQTVRKSSIRAVRVRAVVCHVFSRLQMKKVRERHLVLKTEHF